MGAALGLVGDAGLPIVNNTNRMAGLDSLRGLASLAVCWFHLTNAYAVGNSARASGSFGWLGVEAFFVISGFVIPYSMHKGGYSLGRNWKTFILKRVVRIDPPYLVAALLSLALWYVSAAMPGFQGHAPQPTATGLLLHLGYLNGIAGYPWLNVVFWTLAIEFQYYLLISLCFGVIVSNRWQQRLLFASAMLIAPFFYHGQTYIFGYLSLFLLGITVFQRRARIIGDAETWFVLVSAFISLLIYFGWPVAIVGLGTALSILVNWEFGFLRRPLVFLGAISYSLYLTHVPIGGRVVNLGRRFIDTQAEEWLLSGFALMICLVFATVFWIWIEKPAQRLASRWNYSKKELPQAPSEADHMKNGIAKAEPARFRPDLDRS